MPYNPALPAGAQYAKRYEHLIDLWNPAATPAPAFITVRRADTIISTPTPVLENAQTNDDLGSANSEVTAWDWLLTYRVIAARNSTTQELVDEYAILDSAVGDAIGDDAVVRARWYHAPKIGDVGDPRGAWEGLFTVAIAPVADGNLERWAVTMTGKGPATRLATNPFDGRV